MSATEVAAAPVAVVEELKPVEAPKADAATDAPKVEETAPVRLSPFSVRSTIFLIFLYRLRKRLLKCPPLPQRHPPTPLSRKPPPPRQLLQKSPPSLFVSSFLSFFFILTKLFFFLFLVG
jgi:hypothetical protein